MASSSKPPLVKKEPFTSSSSLLPQPSKPIGKAVDPAAGAEQPEKPSAADYPKHLIPSPEEVSLAKSSHLTRQELLRRRLNHVQQLSRVYRDHYWALMEELRAQYREFYWRFGTSPCKDDDEREMAGPADVEGSGETTTHYNCGFGGNGNFGGGGGGKLGLGFGDGGSGAGLELKFGGNNRCTFVGCKLKAMALTAFCQLHILSDPHQIFYKPCNYVIKSAQAGPIICGKPILRSNVPSLCNVHFQKAQKHVTRALKKAGLTSNSSKVAPKFHVIVAEYVRQIKAKRRALQKPVPSNAVIKEECVN